MNRSRVFIHKTNPYSIVSSVVSMLFLASDTGCTIISFLYTLYNGLGNHFGLFAESNTHHSSKLNLTKNAASSDDDNQGTFFQSSIAC